MSRHYSGRICSLLLLWLLVSGCTESTSDRLNTKKSKSPLTESSPASESDAADVTLQILDWDELQKLIDSHRGKVVVVDAWSTSCEPCKREFPNLVALHKKHGPEKLACISLSLDYEGIGAPEEQREPVLAFLRQQGATFENVLSSVESFELMEKLEIPSIPAVFVYDAAGNLHRRFDNRDASRSGGPFTYEQVTETVEKLVAEFNGRDDQTPGTQEPRTRKARKEY